MEHPQVILDLQRAYVDNGTNIVYAPTFTGNRIKLLEYGLQEKINEINTTLVGLSKQAVGDRALVAADMTMTGRQLFPLGDLMFEELWRCTRSRRGFLMRRAQMFSWSRQ